MDSFAKLQALTGNLNVIGVDSTMDSENWPKACHLYEGTDSDDDDENITSGRAARKAFPLIASQKSIDISQQAGDSTIPTSTYTNSNTEYAFEVGKLAPSGEVFCSFQAVKKYPYTYVGINNRKRVDDEFFAQGKLYNNSWDLFYIYRESLDPNQQPILLVRTRQFEDFLSSINQKLQTSLSIPVSAKGSFHCAFFHDGTHQPRYLGRVLTKEMAEELTRNIPLSSFKLANEPDAVIPSDKTITAFRKKIEMLNQAKKGKKSTKPKKMQMEKKKDWNDSIKRVQRYLGLRAVNKDRIAEVEVNQVARSEWRGDDAPKYPRAAVFDPDQQALFGQDRSVVFVSIDVEAYERDTKKITEIGVATLDTKDIVSVSPGKGGIHWRTAIRSRHFRIKEYKHLNNTEFVSGCADRFEFGDSEFIRLVEAPHVISTCFKHPFSKPGIRAIEEDPKRNIILVGHDVGADISFLRTIGYDVGNLSNILDVADTANMWKYHKRELNPRKLGFILEELGILGWNLHNAGNDAVYTLQAMIAIAIKHLEDRQKESDPKKQEKKILDQQEGWSSTGNNSDGGHPVVDFLVLEATKKPQSQQRAAPSNNSTTPWCESAALIQTMAPSSLTTVWPEIPEDQTNTCKTDLNYQEPVNLQVESGYDQSTTQSWASSSQTPDDILNSSWDTPPQKVDSTGLENLMNQTNLADTNTKDASYW